MIRLAPRSTPLYSSAASDVYKRQVHARLGGRLHAGADVGAQLLERVELADVDGEGVVEVGDDLALDLLHVDLERGRLTGELLGLVVLGKRHVEGGLLAAPHPDPVSYTPLRAHETRH